MDVPEAWNSGPAKIEFSFATQTIIQALVPTASTSTQLFSAERVVELQRHAKHGYGMLNKFRNLPNWTSLTNVVW